MGWGQEWGMKWASWVLTLGAYGKLKWALLVLRLRQQDPLTKALSPLHVLIPSNVTKMGK